MRVTKVNRSKATPAKRPVAAAPPALSTVATIAAVAKARRALPLAVNDRPAVKRANPTDAQTSGYMLDEQVGFRLRRAHQRALAIFNDLMGKYDVTPPQFATLAKLDEMGPMSQHQLARLVCLEHAEMLAVIGRLQRQNLMRARPSPQDVRLIQLELTPDAQQVLAAMKAAATKVSAKTLAPLSPAEVKTLNALLERIG
jgi:MarR family transcriptional regulator, lower aerobic nicotinate degradation pathway regulator